MRTQTIQIANTYGPPRTVIARPVNAVFAVYREFPGEPWTLSHLPTGWSAGRYKTLRGAQAAARELSARFGVKRWQFDDPMQAKKLKGARRIIKRNGGWS